MLSIIIPTLNEEKYLPLLLGSIKKQNFKDYEIIVADANSKDKTVKIAKNYGCKVIAGGLPAKGRNQGAKIAKGDLFLFLDADTILPSPQFLTELIEKFKKGKLKIATFPFCPVKDFSTFCNSSSESEKIDKACYRAYNFWVKISQNFLAHAGGTAILVKKEIHQKIGGFDEEIKLGEDHAYARKAAKVGEFGFLPLPSILISSRRFESDGRLRVYLKYVLAGAYMFFKGPIKSDVFKYRFGHYCQKSEKKLK